MALPILPCGRAARDYESHYIFPIQPIQEAASSTEISVSKIVEEMLTHPAATPPSDDSCPIMTFTEGANLPHLGRIMFYLPTPDQIQFSLALNPVLEKDLKPLLSSFGITYPYIEENAKQTLGRIKEIDHLFKKNITIAEERKEDFVFRFYEEIAQDPKKLYTLLKQADIYNLVSIISKNTSSLDFTGKSFPQKVAVVFDYLQQQEETITELSYCNSYCDSYLWKTITNVPKEIFSFGNIQELSLNSNSLAFLPEGIGSLVQLRILSLNNNKLTTLPEEICGLVQLRKLSLYHNSLTALPRGMSSLVQLQELRLSNNSLTALPEEIGGLVNLQVLSLDDNSLTALPEGISRLVQLQTLCLDNNELTDLPEGVGDLGELRCLTLAGNSFTELPACLGQLPKIRQIILHPRENKKVPDSFGKRGVVCYYADRYYENDSD